MAKLYREVSQPKEEKKEKSFRVSKREVEEREEVNGVQEVLAFTFSGHQMTVLV